jgi:CRP/FNR family cyclic AMP-dependent transcriptional regulator
MISDMEAKHFKSGEIIFNEGDPAGSVFLIDKGAVEITKKVDGASITLTTLGWNELFGEMALVDNSPRSASAVAIEDTWAYKLDKVVFEGKIKEMHPFMQAVFAILVSTTRDLTETQAEHLSSIQE